MPITRTVRVALASSLVLLSCSTTPTTTRDPSGAPGAAYVVPTAEELFIEGRFMVKKNPLKFLDEDHYGEELDLSERRPAVDLRGTVFETKYSRAGSRLIGNFYHRGRFYIARVPDRAVKNVHFQLTYFPPKALGAYVAAHSLLRFELATPIELVAPMPSAADLTALASTPPPEGLNLLAEPMSGEDVYVRNVIISAEAQWTKNDKYKAYSLKRGMLGAFIQIVRFESAQTRFEAFYDSGNPTTQIKFELKDEGSGDRILREALRTSESDALTKLYDTFWYNCTTLAFDIVERAQGFKDERLGFIRSFMEKRVPVIAPKKLEQYGGLEAAPMETDPSLLDDSEEAYQDKIVLAKRPLCPVDFEKDECENVKGAVEALKKADRI